MRRLSCVVERRVQTIDANYFMHTTINHPRRTIFVLVPLTALAASAYRQQQYDDGYTIVDTLLPLWGEAKCIIPLRNHSTIHKLMQTQQSTELHILIAAPPPLWCHRHRNNDKHNNMPTIRCIRKHSEGGRVHVGVVHCVPCSIYHRYLQQPNRLAIEHTTIN